MSYNVGNYMAGEHGGTHMDAPFHFSKNGHQVHEIPLERLQAPAVIVDVREQVKEDPEYMVRSNDINRRLSRRFVLCIKKAP